MHKLPISPSAFTVSPRPEPRFRKAHCCPLASALETRPSETALQFPLILEGELEQAMAALQAELGAHVGARRGQEGVSPHYRRGQSSLLTQIAGFGMVAPCHERCAWNTKGRFTTS